jgi:hypothetical protein
MDRSSGYHLARAATVLLLCRNMPRYVIERDIPGVGGWSPAELTAVSRKSCEVLRAMGPRIQWLHSYVTGDKIYCLYIAPDEATLREHARQGGFPADRIAEVKSIIDPTTAEGG